MEKIREYNRKLPNLTDAPDSRVVGFHTGQRGVSLAVPTFGPGFSHFGTAPKKVRGSTHRRYSRAGFVMQSQGADLESMETIRLESG